MNGNNVWWRVVLALVLVVAVLGLAGLAFQAGVTQGAAQKIVVPQNGTAPMPYYGAPYFFGPHMWFGGLGCFVPLIGLFLLFAVFRGISFLIWGPRWGWRHHGPWGMHHGHWGGPQDDPESWNKGVPPPIAEWHRRMHEDGPSQTDGK